MIVSLGEGDAKQIERGSLPVRGFRRCASGGGEVQSGVESQPEGHDEGS